MRYLSEFVVMRILNKLTDNIKQLSNYKGRITEFLL